MISVIALLSLVAFQILLGIDCWLYTKWVENTDYSEIVNKGPKRMLPFSGFYFYFKDKFK